jgi:hypothetical protein
VWSVLSVGWLKAQGPTSPHPTPSCCCTIANHPNATGTLYSTSYTTFTHRSTMALHSRPRYKFLSTCSCRSLHHLTPKHTPTSSHLRLLNIIFLSTYSDACWGSQLGNAILKGIQLPLFKFWSMSGGIVMRSGGPIVWKADCQERTALSSCDAEIRATNMSSRLTVNTRNMISGLSDLGYPIHDCESSPPLSTTTTMPASSGAIT